MQDETELEIEIANCCASCDYSPFKGKKGKKTRMCLKSKEFVFQIAYCELYERNEITVARRLRGLDSAISQKVEYDV